MSTTTQEPEVGIYEYTRAKIVAEERESHRRREIVRERYEGQEWGTHEEAKSAVLELFPRAVFDEPRLIRNFGDVTVGTAWIDRVGSGQIGSFFLSPGEGRKWTFSPSPSCYVLELLGSN